MARSRSWRYGFFSLAWPGTGTGIQSVQLDSALNGETYGHIFIRASWAVISHADNLAVTERVDFLVATGLGSTVWALPPQDGTHTFLYGTNFLVPPRYRDGTNAERVAANLHISDEGHGQKTIDQFSDGLYLAANAGSTITARDVRFVGVVKALRFSD